MSFLQPRTEHRFDPREPHPELEGVDIGQLQHTDWENNSDPFGMYTSKGLPPPPVVSAHHVRRQAKERVSSIMANYRLLRAIVERHEEKIQKRWEKKTKAQRLAILLQQWPEMPKDHRPEFAAFRKHPQLLHQAAARYSGSFRWPYINQEDLAKPRTLPLLLSSRGRNHPSVFAAADGDSMHLGKVSMVIVPVFLNCYIMLLNGMTRDDDYGKVVGFEEHPDAFYWMTTRKQFLPGEGLVILEAQDRLLAFLVSCCKQILHEIPPGELTGDKHPILPEPCAKANAHVGGLASLATLAQEAPYRVPARLDLEKIESLLAARASRAEEHLWALREDPSYFAEQLIEMREHRQEMLKDTQGSLHPTMKLPRQGLLWARVIGDVILQATLQLEFFSELHGQARKLRILHRKYEREISPLRDLPEEFLGALLKFRHYLNQVTKGPLNLLKQSVVASPPMRQFFVREVPESSSSSKITVTGKPGVKLDKTTSHLIWLLRTLWEDGYNLFICRLPTLVDELDRLMQADQKARDLISPYVAMLVGDLAVTGECLRQLDIYQPWANNFEAALCDREKDIKAEFAERTKLMAQVMDTLREEKLLRLSPFGDPSDNKFDYPVGRRRNKENTEKLRAAEANLDAFWRKFDETLYAKLGSLEGTSLGHVLSKAWPLQRTPPWAEPAAVKADEPGKDSRTSPEAPAKPFSTLFIGHEEPSPRKELPAEREARRKVKTRGAAQTCPAPTADAAALATPFAEARPTREPVLWVDSRSLKVFRIVFFDPTANTTPGEVAWTDFLHAMNHAGFSARKLYGSVWHFQPTVLDVERSIQFHEPHPRGKIPFLIARRHGRRLHRAYGWTDRTFALKAKDDTHGG
ncbi:hypothetical protein UVI_02000140 [Ustilaginoidea virens]|uniref:Uncharacterized protein n=1 Tax=Ustilaginoidea virens TaxID=1159556 RepID=A0A1B5KYZ2_USTVR|nr:hypothetical protein UVI_02000140 [Ustilaginoidea virens]